MPTIIGGKLISHGSISEEAEPVKVKGEVEVFLAHTARAVQDVVEERGAATLLTVLDDKTTFVLWKELTSGEYYGR